MPTIYIAAIFFHLGPLSPTRAKKVPTLTPCRASTSASPSPASLGGGSLSLLSPLSSLPLLLAAQDGPGAVARPVSAARWPQRHSLWAPMQRWRGGAVLARRCEQARWPPAARLVAGCAGRPTPLCRGTHVSWPRNDCCPIAAQVKVLCSLSCSPSPSLAGAGMDIDLG